MRRTKQIGGGEEEKWRAASCFFGRLESGVLEWDRGRRGREITAPHAIPHL